MKGLTKRDIPVLVFCISAVILVAVFSFVYRDGIEKINAASEANESLTAEIEQLREKESNRQFYLDETARMQEEIDAIYSYFPADVLIEDGIVSSMTLENEAPMISEGIGYTPAVEIYTAGQGGPAADASGAVDSSQGDTSDYEDNNSPEEDAIAASDGGAAHYAGTGEAQFASAQLPSGYVGEYGPITLRNSVFTYNFETSYPGFKNIVDYFTYLPGRSTIADVALGYDSGTGLLNGSMTVNRYSLTGTGATYSPPSFPAVSTGKQNIFGTIELAGGEKPSDSEENEGGESEEETQ